MAVVSDHGSGGASDRVVHLNRYLASQGFLGFRPRGGASARAARRLALRAVPFRLQGSLLRRAAGCGRPARGRGALRGHRLVAHGRVLGGARLPPERLDQPRGARARGHGRRLRTTSGRATPWPRRSPRWRDDDGRAGRRARVAARGGVPRDRRPSARRTCSSSSLRPTATARRACAARDRGRRCAGSRRTSTAQGRAADSTARTGRDGLFVLAGPGVRAAGDVGRRRDRRRPADAARARGHAGSATDSTARRMARGADERAVLRARSARGGASGRRVPYAEAESRRDRGAAREPRLPGAGALMRVALVIAGPYPALSRLAGAGVAPRARARASAGTTSASSPTASAAGDARGRDRRRVALDAVLVARLWRVVRRERIDVIHAHNYEAAIAGLLVGARDGSAAASTTGTARWRDELPHVRLRRRCAPGDGRARPAARRARAAAGGLLHRRHRRRWARTSGAPGVREQTRSRASSPRGAPDELAAGQRRPRPSPGSSATRATSTATRTSTSCCAASRCVRAAVPGARLVLVTHADARAHAARLAAAVGRRTWRSSRRRRTTRSAIDSAAAAVAVCPRAERSGFPMKLLNYMARGQGDRRLRRLRQGPRRRRHRPRGARRRRRGDSRTRSSSLLRDPAAAARGSGGAARRAVESRAAWDSVLDRIESIYRRVGAGGAARAAARRRTE